METGLISIDYRDPAWIAIAFAFGLVFRRVGLPPMVGFLVAGFVLHLLGAESDQFLLEIADLGVTLLLFTIGLKLRVSTLVRPEIWATMSIHMGVSIAFTAALLYVLAAIGLPLFTQMDALAIFVVAFALSFSSTVFAVKTLEDRGAVLARFGQVAIGILVLQDIAAVAFLAASVGKLPTVWALALLALIPARYVLSTILTNSDHKELLVVFGFVLALGGASLFEVVGLKGDLGALVLGVLLAGHPRANELSRNLMGFKDVFLVCFFLTIGMFGLPTWQTVFAALPLLLLLPLKVGLYLLLFTRFRLRARAATLGASVLGNFSEFGLIVGAVATSAGWLPAEWLTVIALAVSASFILSAPVNAQADSLYARFRKRLRRFERAERLPGDEDIQLAGNRVLIFGMGRVGRAAYDEMQPHLSEEILGVDLDEAEVARNVEAGRRVVRGDATHPDFWSRLDERHEAVNMILLAMPDHGANINAARRFRDRGFPNAIVATALYPDEEESLREAGVDEVFNIYAQAGAGAASRMWATVKEEEEAES